MQLRASDGIDSPSAQGTNLESKKGVVGLPMKFISNVSTLVNNQWQALVINKQRNQRSVAGDEITGTDLLAKLLESSLGRLAQRSSTEVLFRYVNQTCRTTCQHRFSPMLSRIGLADVFAC